MPFLRLSQIYPTAFSLLILNSPGHCQQAGTEKFNKKVIANGLSDPWEIIFGPDLHLWVTESKGYRVLRIDPATGAK
ncbi:hypothetical protein LZD49_20140 [Dyadobacter sp. CY261]|uniref:hypothetical protein n=1 Tax=Dyadobacter sp. CY261 TaxID=2907203 RepID=UPI001F3047F2|nr:hypothetical protein [Dyadobacter sp. CY261]MCF0072802.1 hypothetical protein [Dyadobacter sp. CY261]